MKINFITGDATSPIGDGKKIICHICNDIGAWGAGFVLAISKKWKQPEKEYLSMPKSERRLGNVQLVQVETDIAVANMIAQHKVRSEKDHGYIPIRYDAVRECLTAVNKHAVENNATLHAPKFGTGLAGGDWFEIEKIIHEVVTVDVFIYLYP